MALTLTRRTLTSTVHTNRTALNESHGDGYSRANPSDLDGLKLSPCFVLTGNGLAVSGSPSITEWLQVGEQLRQIERHIQLAIGDWLNYGEQNYGEKYAQALDDTGYEYGTLRNFAYVAGRVELSRRRDKLPFSHHQEVAPLEAHEQQEWLTKAERGSSGKTWSRATLRAAIKDAKRGEEKPAWLKHTDVWNFTACDERFGCDYPGRIPGQIVLNTLYYYTRAGDRVIDPMAGGGVTIDACRELGRDCEAFDLYPYREDIQRHDATQNWPVESNAALVFIDPPYGSQLEDDYGGMAKKPYDDYLADMKRVFEQAYRALKNGGYLAILIAPMAVKSETFIDIPFDFVQACTLLGFAYERRICVPVSTQQIQPGIMERCRENDVLAAILRDLVILRKSK